MDDFLKGTTLTFRILYRMNIMRDYQKHGRITFFKLIYFILATFVKRNPVHICLYGIYI